MLETAPATPPKMPAWAKVTLTILAVAAVALLVAHFTGNFRTHG